jgi:hypothetical protein
MNINVLKAQADLDHVRQLMVKRRDQLADLTGKEIALTAFLDMAESYKVSERAKAPRVAKTLRTISRKRVVPVQTPALKRRTIVSQAIVGAFKAGDLLTTKGVLDKIGVLFAVPAGAVSALHHLSPMLTHEIRDRENGILEHVGKAQYRLKDNAVELIAARVARETAAQTTH